MCTDAAYEFDEGSDGAEQCEVLIPAAAPVGVLLTVSVLAALQLLHPGGVSLLMTDADLVGASLTVGMSRFAAQQHKHTQSHLCFPKLLHSAGPSAVSMLALNLSGTFQGLLDRQLNFNLAN